MKGNRLYSTFKSFYVKSKYVPINHIIKCKSIGNPWFQLYMLVLFISEETGWANAHPAHPVALPLEGNTVRIRFKKLLNKKEIQFKKEFLGTKIQFTVVHDSI